MPASPAPRPEGHRSFVWLGLAALAGLLLGLALIPSAHRTPSGMRPPLRLYGQPLPASTDAVDVALGRVDRKFEGWFNLELPDGERRRMNYAALGVQPDRTRLGQLIQLAQAGVVLERAEAESGDRAIELNVPLWVDREVLTSALLALKDELDRSAVDARLDLDHRAVIPERAGRLLDVDRSAMAIERALERGADGTALWFSTEPPRRSASDLARIRHDALLGAYESTSDEGPRLDDRIFNLRRVAARIDGYVLAPGGELDFNAVVGPRDEANGFRVAMSVVAGENADAIGGAASQISGTLHAAALFAGLVILERHPEARPSPYLELGLDAAVAYPALDLRIENPYDFPVVLRATATGRHVRAEVRGARRPYTITLIVAIDGATPFEQIERPDATLELGERALAQRGVPGLDIRRYRIRQNGAHAVREVARDRYAPTPQIVLVGTTERADAILPAATGRPPQPSHREYLAEELLVMTQNAELDGALLEQRVPGRFAVPGWTKTVGAPAYFAAP
jgi:vancomycin resistance protein YoaR